MTDRNQRGRSRIPEFASRGEEAESWRAHDNADFGDEFKSVRVRDGKNLSEGITVRLNPETLRKVRSVAHEKGIGPTTLVRLWILERLNKV